jgi:N-methylhydantoinase B/oxoprolinase/acetone carboxylase alpha subunit
MIADSGGAGEWRGGLGFARDYHILADDVRFSMRTDKHTIEPFGSDHGLPGGKGACIINPTNKDPIRMPSRFGDHRLRTNDIVRVERPGGGGLGNALARPVESVLEDVRQGYVSVERARSDYGVVVMHADEGPKVDIAETRVLRGKK